MVMGPTQEEVTPGRPGEASGKGGLIRQEVGRQFAPARQTGGSGSGRQAGKGSPDRIRQAQARRQGRYRQEGLHRLVKGVPQDVFLRNLVWECIDDSSG
eukprot:8322432-Heterocapsa_arctica.AAC.1